jgi:23S rRNA (uracil-5-)-methyltransferase RumA
MTKEQCPNPELCGSCGWSHIPYDKQLQQKLADINGSFKLKELSLECTEILPSPKVAHYRNRMDFVISFKGEVGLREKGKWWRVIDNHPCFIADEEIDRIFKVTRDWVQSSGLTYFDRKAHTGFLRYAVIRTTRYGQSMMNIITSAPTPEEETSAPAKLLELQKLSGVTSLNWAINHTVNDVSSGDELRVIHGPGYIEEKIGEYIYKLSPHSFFQTNSWASPLLLDTAKEFLQFTPKPKLLLDLYCGSGFFSIALASTAQRTIGVEIVSEMIEDAKINAIRNNVSVEYVSGAAEAVPWQKHGADTIILDPPRSGLHDNAIKQLIEASPKTILYISCNYKSFAREMAIIKDRYEVVKMRAIDMFPHTPHVELVSLLIKKEANV